MKTILTNRLNKLQRLAKCAMSDKNLYKTRQAFNLIGKVQQQLAILSVTNNRHLA